MTAVGARWDQRWFHWPLDHCRRFWFVVFFRGSSTCMCYNMYDTGGCEIYTKKSPRALRSIIMWYRYRNSTCCIASALGFLYQKSIFLTQPTVPFLAYFESESKSKKRLFVFFPGRSWWRMRTHVLYSTPVFDTGTATAILALFDETISDWPTRLLNRGAIDTYFNTQSIMLMHRFVFWQYFSAYTSAMGSLDGSSRFIFLRQCWGFGWG